MNMVIVGATSGIALATAREFAGREHAGFLLIGRNAERLNAAAADLRVRGAANASALACDLTVRESAETVMTTAEAELGGPIDVVLIAQGSLTDEARAASGLAYAEAEVTLNFTSPVWFAYAAAAYFRQAKRPGQIAIVTSVAGERGRSTNFLYGASKAGLIAFASGLRASLFRDGVTVTELRPGFVSTPMTAHLKQGPLFLSAERAGALCARAIRRRRLIAYIPGWWRWIMMIVRAVPEPVFQRLRF